MENDASLPESDIRSLKDRSEQSCLEQETKGLKKTVLGKEKQKECEKV